MIQSFACKETENLFHRRFSRKFPQDIQRIASRKLEVLHAASLLDSIRIPPSNQLKKLKGKRSGQYSIRINDQWRICFRWNNGNAMDVEIVDYH
jgi:proteic killer suppression protein